MKNQEQRHKYGPAVWLFLLGLLLSGLPLLWPLTTTNFDPHYGKFPLWVLANCGVITISSLYSFIIIALYRKWVCLWIPVVGFLLIPVSLMGGLVFWVIGIFLFPVGPVILLVTSVITLKKNNVAEQDVAPDS